MDIVIEYVWHVCAALGALVLLRYYARTRPLHAMYGLRAVVAQGSDGKVELTVEGRPWFWPGYRTFHVRRSFAGEWFDKIHGTTTKRRWAWFVFWERESLEKALNGLLEWCRECDAYVQLDGDEEEPEAPKMITNGVAVFCFQDSSYSRLIIKWDGKSGKVMLEEWHKGAYTGSERAYGQLQSVKEFERSRDELPRQGKWAKDHETNFKLLGVNA